MDANNYISVRDAAVLLERSQQMVLNYIGMGYLKANRVGKKYYILVDSLDRMLKRRDEGKKPEPYEKKKEMPDVKLPGSPKKMMDVFNTLGDQNKEYAEMLYYVVKDIFGGEEISLEQKDLMLQIICFALYGNFHELKDMDEIRSIA